MAETTGISTHDQARILSEALPYMQRYEQRTVVVKYGGHAMGDAALARAFAQDIGLLRQAGVLPVVVHGGGPQIGAMLERMRIKSEFIDGLRVTDAATIEIVEMVLAGAINKEIVQMINATGARAVGLSGKDGRMVTAKKVTRTKRDPDSNIEKVVDLGFVGEPDTIDRRVLDSLIHSGLIPVLAPIAISGEGETLNVNADTFAGSIAGVLDAKRLLVLTDVPGVLDKDGKLITELTVGEARELVANGTISGGMIPKIDTCIHAIQSGVEAVVIVDGKVPHAVLLELLTNHGAGTMIRR